MFNSKFNPDVVYSFENENKSRINTKYEIKNIPYKVITKENKLIKSTLISTALASGNLCSILLWN